MSLKKLRKKLKKTFAAKAVKSIGRGAAKVAKYGAPIVGAVVAGPVGALAGTALSAGASQVGPNKNRGAALKRALIYGGAVTGGAAAISVLGGSSLTTGVLTSAGRIFAPGSAPPGANVTSDPGSLDNAFLTGTPDNNGTPGSGNTLNSLANAFLGGNGPAVPGNQAGGDETRSPFGDPNLGGMGGRGGADDDGGFMGSGFSGRGVLIGVGVIVLILIFVATAGKRRAAA